MRFFPVCASHGIWQTMSAMARLSWFMSLAFALAAVPAARTADASHSAPIRPPAPAAVQSPALAYARDHGLPMERIDVAPGAGAGRYGDTVVALVTLRDRRSTRQWLTQFQLAAATAKEEAEHPSQTATVNVNHHPYQFASGTPVALRIQTIGPFGPGLKPPVDGRDARALVSPAFLGLGIDRACAALLTSEKAVDEAAKNALSDDTLHAVAGLFPAMAGFFMGVQSTPGLREILWEVLEKPSLWSIVKRGGKIEPGFNFEGVALADAADWGVPGLPCYQLKLSLAVNGQPALHSTFFVTAPRPPLLTTAGIMGILAESPVDPNKRVEIRVLATRSAGSP